MTQLMRVEVNGGDVGVVVVVEEGVEEVIFMSNCKVEKLQYNSLHFS
jgi:hypothetical protein